MRSLSSAVVISLSVQTYVMDEAKAPAADVFGGLKLVLSKRRGFKDSLGRVPFRAYGWTIQHNGRQLVGKLVLGWQGCSRVD